MIDRGRTLGLSPYFSSQRHDGPPTGAMASMQPHRDNAGNGYDVPRLPRDVRHPPLFYYSIGPIRVSNSLNGSARLPGPLTK